MAIKIDLLPQESKIKPEYLRASKVAKKFNIAFYTVFMVISISLLGYILILNNTYKNTEAKNESLKAEIKKLESSEQKIVLLRDRLSRIRTVLNSPSAGVQFDRVKPIIESLGTEASVSQLKVQSSEIEMGLNFLSAKAYTDFSDKVKQGQFKDIIITNFSFSPISGYSINLAIKPTK